MAVIRSTRPTSASVYEELSQILQSFANALSSSNEQGADLGYQILFFLAKKAKPSHSRSNVAPEVVLGLLNQQWLDLFMRGVMFGAGVDPGNMRPDGIAEALLSAKRRQARLQAMTGKKISSERRKIYLEIELEADNMLRTKGKVNYSRIGRNLAKNYRWSEEKAKQFIQAYQRLVNRHGKLRI